MPTSVSPRPAKYCRLDAIEGVHEWLPQDGFTPPLVAMRQLMPCRAEDRRYVASTVLGITEGASPKVILNIGSYLALEALPPETKKWVTVPVVTYSHAETLEIINHWIDHEPLFINATKTVCRELLAAYWRKQPSLIDHVKQRAIARKLRISTKTVQRALKAALSK